MTGEHPDANLLAAFTEGRLLGREREDVLAHLAACAECREIVALAAAPEPRHISQAWRWMAAAAAAALIVIGAWGLRVILAPLPKATIASERPPSPMVSLPAAAEPQIAPAPKAAPRAAVPKPARRAPTAKQQRAQPVEQFLASRQVVAPAAGSMDLTARTGLARSNTQAASASGAALWRINAYRVQRSMDGGVTWHFLPMSGEAFYAVAAAGADVWAGGAHGVLLHSSNAGMDWKEIRVGNGAEILNGTIVAIRRPNAADVILETDSGQQWISHDNGLSWNPL